MVRVKCQFKTIKPWYCVFLSAVLREERSSVSFLILVIELILVEGGHLWRRKYQWCLVTISIKARCRLLGEVFNNMERIFECYEARIKFDQLIIGIK